MAEAACFDNDGLFLETESGWSRAEVVLFERHGSAFTDDHKRYLIGSSGPEAQRKLEEMLGRPGAELWTELHALVIEEFRRAVEPMPGAVELAQALRAQGTPVALVSNSAHELVSTSVGTAGVGGVFAGVFPPHRARHRQP